MTTFVWEHPDVHYDMITTGFDRDNGLFALMLKVRKRKLPVAGWTLKLAHNDEHSNPSMDEGVRYTTYD